MALALDRKAFVDILSEGRSQSAVPCCRRPTSRLGLPEDQVKALYGDVEKNRAQARELMKQAGYGPTSG